jgi:hypothetical protein
MVICDGFNKQLEANQSLMNNFNEANGGNIYKSSTATPTAPTSNTSSSSILASPFPRPPPQPSVRQSLQQQTQQSSQQQTGSNDASENYQNLNGGTSSQPTGSNGHSYEHANNIDQPDFASPILPMSSTTNKNTIGSNSSSSKSSGIQLPSKLQIQPPPPPQASSGSSSACNYDNLRSIDSDDSRLTSPDMATSSNTNFLFNGTAPQTTNKLAASVSFTNSTNGKTQQQQPPVPLKSTPIIQNSQIATNIQQQQTSSLPLSDKNLMTNIMNRSNVVNDPKSQSMFAASNANANTPVLAVSYIKLKINTII